MKIITDPSQISSIGRSVISIGNFDGVHLGHRMLLDQLCQLGKKHQSPTIVFTFDPHPLSILRPGKFLPRLNWVSRKAELLGKCGVDYLIAYPTSLELLELPYTEFFNEFIVDKMKAIGMVEGPNFSFGKDRMGTVDNLKKLCSEKDIELKILPIEKTGDSIVSSSHIRGLISEGYIEKANELLTEPYAIRGVVKKGSQRGSSIGFPTANLHDVETLIPKEGVYCGSVEINDTSYRCAINIGMNPTFQDDNQKIEVHIIGANADLYGQTITVAIEKRIRSVLKFDSPDELINQIRSDIEFAKSN